MNELQTRIIEDLAGLLRGEVRCDDVALAMYASDGSLYQIPPLGVVYPLDREDVIALARYAAEKELPLIARGAGTGLAGESLGRGLVVDFSRHMRNILEIGENTVRVQPGVVCSQLNAALRERGRYFPPDPSGAAVTTVGSMLALDAAGSHSVRVGSTRDHVRSLEVVLAGGDCFEIGIERLGDSNGNGAGTGSGMHAIPYSDAASSPRRKSIIEQLATLLRDNAPLIAKHQPPRIRNRAGYHLRGVLNGRSLHLARMLVGSEGTLGLFTAATLHTAPLPAARGVVLMLFGQMEAALRAVQALALQQPSACDLLDRRLLSLARDADARFAELIHPEAEAALIVEQAGYSERQIRDRIQRAIQTVQFLPNVSVVTHEAYSLEDVERLWSLPEKVVPRLARLQGPTRPLPIVEDVAVPPDVLPDFLPRAQNVFQKHRVTASLYAHAAAGQLHMRPFLEPPHPEQGPQIEALARDLYHVVFDCGGTVSGEHGDGLSRSAFLSQQYGPLYNVFRQIKAIFDPKNLLNPGKVITDDPHLTSKNLRPAAAPAEAPLEWHLRWNTLEVLQVASRCNGCGHCRTQEHEQRMCPVFRIAPLEDASPRAKANLMRHLATGTISPEASASPEFKQLADLCFNCKQCQLECPSNVDIPHLMIEAKAAFVAAHGLKRADWILSQAHSFGELASAASMLSNWIVGNPLARWVLEKVIGISRQRKLPLFARRSFLRTARREWLARPSASRTPKPVIYFVDHYANYHDPELARAFVEILRHNHIPVYVPPGQVATGMAMISAGDLYAARELAEQNLRELAEWAREGCQIVCTEPAAALCLSQEYPKLMDHPEVNVVASQVIEAGAFLERLHREGKLRTDFQSIDLDVGYHTPCHLKALGAGTPLVNLLRLIPRLRLHNIDEGCSGMAGAYGLTREHFQDSIRIGWGLISRMRTGDLTIGTTECSSCKLQMEQGTTTPTLHPLKLLALAYGLMPEVRQHLKPNLKKLTMS